MSEQKRRGPYPEPLDPDRPPMSPTEHSHRQRRTPWIVTWVAVALLCVAVGLLTVYVVRFNDYVQGRGHTRDAENARLQEQIRRSECDLLDQLPASVLLDGPRQKYGCGPGIPVSELPPAIRQQWSPPVVVPAPSSAAPTTTTPAPDRTEGATAPSREAPAPVPPRPTEAPPAPTAPPTPVDPVLCQLLKICVEVH